MTRKTILGAIAAAGCLMASVSQGATATYYFNWINNVSPPGPTSTLATLVVSDDGTNGVKFVLDANHANPLLAGANPLFDDLGFQNTANLSGAGVVVPGDDCSHDPGNQACPAYEWLGVNKTMDGFGQFNDVVGMPTAAEADRRDPMVFWLKGFTLATLGLGGTNSKGYSFAAHFYPNGGAFAPGATFFIGSKPGDEYLVPLPATAWLLASGVLGLLGIGRRRRTASATA